MLMARFQKEYPHKTQGEKGKNKNLNNMNRSRNQVVDSDVQTWSPGEKLEIVKQYF